MAQSEAESGLQLTISETVQGLVESYRQMTIPIERYLFFILLPSVAFFLISVVAAVFLNQPIMIRAPIPLLGFLAMVSAIFYPKILLSQRKRELNDRFHLMITHMTVLATTKIDRMEVFRTLAEEDEYGELAMEMYRITQLVDTWNLGLDDACRRRAKEVPSDDR